MNPVWAVAAAILFEVLPVLAGENIPEKRALQNETLLREIANVHHLTETQTAAVRAVFSGSAYIGQGNPAISRHAATTEQCLEKLTAEAVSYDNPDFEKICGDKYMAPLYDPATQKPEDARVCIDQFEFPDIPCAYPVVWVRAREAAQLCAAMGKRLCDAHEWEGACAGVLEEPDYDFKSLAGMAPTDAIHHMRAAHNRKYQASACWSYGKDYREGICAASSFKTPGCQGGGWGECGSNTFPAGYYPLCHSPLMVFDLNGNAAEHMNLPLSEDQMASRGSQTLGYTEMKGSWFIFDTYRAHPDWCRWRAPFWHGSRVMDPQSHHNYHLGFRCCKTIGE
jgi:hypothetical protein